MKFVNAQGDDYAPTRWLTFNDVLLRPRRSSYRSRLDVSLKTSLGLIDDGRSLDPCPLMMMDIPFISANMDTVTDYAMSAALHNRGGLGILHRFYKDENEYLGDIERQFIVQGRAAFSVGCGDKWLKFIEQCQKRNINQMIVCLDVAHGHTDHAIEMVEKMRPLGPSHQMFIVAGNIATGDAAFDMAIAGANAVKVGVGCGSLCTTRLVTGAGVPQLSAIIEVREQLDRCGFSHVGIIADGGIRQGGDVVKAIAAGANAVMIGQLFAGTDESPGQSVISKIGLVKRYRGQSSRNFMDDIGKNGAAAEGIHLEIPCKGSVLPILEELIGGLRSGLTYSGCGSISELQEKAEFVEISEQGWIESIPHATLTHRNQ